MAHPQTGLGAAVLPLCFMHFVVDLVCRSLGMEGSLAPAFAAWLPIVLFGSLGLVLFGSSKT